MTEHELNDFSTVIEDFQRARVRAKLEQVLAWLSGQSPHLLEYDEVRKKLRATAQLPRGLQDIPLDAIVGITANTGNVVAPPGLTEPSPAWAKSTARLLPGSAAVDQGSFGNGGIPDHDMDHEPRPDPLGSPDIGHDELQP